MRKQARFLVLTILLSVAILLTGCGTKKADTRQYMRTIGAVITNDVNVVFDELYVYSGDVHDMGEDFIKNTTNVTKVGSYGVTMEELDSYYVLVRDASGGVYQFEAVKFENADLGVITFTDELLLTVHHRSGGEEVVVGEYIPPKDAPDQPHNTLKKKVEFAFEVENDTGGDIAYVTMREAADQDKGDVELHLEEMPDGEVVKVGGELYEEEQEITEWVLYVEMMDGTFGVSKEVFDPWTAEKLVVSQNGRDFHIDVVETGGSSSVSQPASSAPAESADSSAAASE